MLEEQLKIATGYKDDYVMTTDNIFEELEKGKKTAEDINEKLREALGIKKLKK